MDGMNLKSISKFIFYDFEDGTIIASCEDEMPPCNTTILTNDFIGRLNTVFFTSIGLIGGLVLLCVLLMFFLCCLGCQTSKLKK